MPTECSPTLFGFAPVENRQVVAGFDGGAITSKGSPPTRRAGRDRLRSAAESSSPALRARSQGMGRRPSGESAPRHAVREIR